MANPRDLTLGFILPQWSRAMGGETASGGQVIALAQLAERVGFDGVWAIDHLTFEPYADQVALGLAVPEAERGVKVGVWECWTTLGALAVATERVTIGTLVSNAGVRHPAQLAAMATTIDELSGGRLILGLGAGTYRSEYQAYGYPWERRVGRFEEALRILRPLLRGERVSFAGEFYALREAELVLRGPRPAGPPLLIGVFQAGPRMQRLAARYADICESWLVDTGSQPRAYAAQRAAVDAACERHGRDPATLARQATVAVVMPGYEHSGSLREPLTGSVAAVAAQLAEFAEQGVGHLSIFAQPKSAAGIAWLGRVIEALRA